MESNKRLVKKIVDWIREYCSSEFNMEKMLEEKMIPDDFLYEAGKRGLFGMRFPKEYGGLALSVAEMESVIEQISAVDVNLATYLVVQHTFSNPLLLYGNPQFKGFYLPQIASGKCLGCFALSEPDAGSNPRNISTSIAPAGRGKWIINGTKSWITGAASADMFLVFGHHEENSGYKGISCFAVPKSINGIEVQEGQNMLSINGVGLRSIVFDHVIIGEEYLIGEIGKGMVVAESGLLYGRLFTATIASGIMKRCGQLMYRYAGNRNIGSGMLLDNPITVMRLREVKLAIATVEATDTFIADQIDSNMEIPEDFAIACKVASSELAWETADSMVQLLGARGLVQSNIASHILADVRFFKIGEGPSEPLLTKLGAALALTNSRLMRYLRDDLSATEVCTELTNNIKSIKQLIKDYSIKRELKHIVYYAIGKVGMWSFLEAALNWKQEKNIKEIQEAVEWVRGRTKQALCEVQTIIINIAGEDGTLERDIERYSNNIGTIEESMPYGGESLDELLRDLKGADYHKESVCSDTTVIELFENNVVQNGNSMAVISPGRIISYKELDDDVNKLCHALNNKGVVPGDVVAVILDKSPLLATGLLAILKSGAAILMLNANDPMERNQLMMESAGVKSAISVIRLKYLQYDKRTDVIYIDEDVHDNMKNVKRFPNMASPASVAYVAYTSGSTGVPKGVRVSHNAICSQILARCESLSICTEDRILHSIAPNFDIAIWETISPFVYGCALVLNNEETFHYEPRKIIDMISEYGVTLLQATTTQLGLLLNNISNDFVHNLKGIFSGGEVLPDSIIELFARKLPGVELVHLYGPTEAVIDTCYCKPFNSRNYVTGEIGEPFSNKKLYVLNEKQEEVSDHMHGELYIGGVIAEGYLYEPELTETHFLEDKFSDGDGDKMYKSGDIVQKLPSGKLKFLHRSDQQIKLNGVRMEEGEIESVMCGYPAINQVKVVIRKTRGNSVLAAYYTAENNKYIDKKSLRTYMTEYLPASMVPSLYIRLDEFPLTSTGKIDKHALPDLNSGEMEEDFFDKEEEVTPVQSVIKIWEELLEHPISDPSIDFFDMGGNSLMVIQMLTRIWELYAVEIDVIDFYEDATITGLCKIISDKTSAGKDTMYSDTKVERESLLGTQKNYWYMYKLDESSAAYNCPEAVRFHGELNDRFLEESINEIIARHDVLKTAFADEGGEPYQVVYTEKKYVLSIEDIPGNTKDEQEHELIRNLERESSRVFRLEEAPLFAAKLFRMDKLDHVFFWNFHHIIADGWSSAQVFKAELNECYRAKYENRKPNLPQITMQPIEYLRWQEEMFTPEKYEQQKNYWLEELKDAPSETDISMGGGRSADGNMKGRRVNFSISAVLYDSLKAFSRKMGVSNYNVLVTTFSALAHTLSGLNDICIGTVVAGRKNSRIEPVMGNFSNVVVLRTVFEENTTVEMLLEQVKNKTLKALANSDIPFEEVVSALKPNRNKNKNPLFNIFFSLFNGKEQELAFPGVEVEPIPMDPEFARFDLSIAMFEVNQCLNGYVEYRENLYGRDTIDRIIKYFITALSYMIASPVQYIDHMELVDEQEKELLCHIWNNTYAPFPDDICMHELFEQQVRRIPDKIAVCFEGKNLTYQELNAKANKLARYLIAQKIEIGDFVGICIKSSIEMMVGILGILKAGAAYVPIDPVLPEKRVAFILNEINSKVIVTQSEFAQSLLSGCRSICMDTEWDLVDIENDDNLNLTMTSNQIIYMIYTSGSTGTPKAVRTMHYNVAALLCNTNHMHPDESDRFLKINNFAFDISTWEIWTPLIYGGTMVIIPDNLKLRPLEFAEFVKVNEVTMAYLPTALYHAISVEIPSAFEKMKLLIVGGEALDPSRARAVLSNNPPKSFVNALGPTEVTCSSAWYEVNNLSEDALTVPIGKPITNTQFYVLNSRMKVLPVGVTGELFIGGAGVSDGYHNRPELTDKNFIPNPFKHDGRFSRLYRSGDLVKYQKDGNLLSMGRKDNQIKIRGFRIEIGEIENAIREHEAVNTAAVLVKGERQDDYQLYAYVLLKDGEADIQIDSIKQHLKTRLPYYMIPTELIVLDTMPYNKNGKVDRRALAMIQKPAKSSPAGVRYPRNIVEIRLAGIWESVVGKKVPNIQLGFFEAGGDSLKAIRLLALIKKEFSVELPIETLFEQGTIEELAMILRKENTNIKNKALLAFNPKIEHSQKPVFLVHPLSGSSICYGPFADLVGHSVYGLQQLGNSDIPSLNIGTIEELAEYYLKCIEAFSVEEAFLGGWSMGGIIAFEMTRQLEKRGSSVNKLILFDSAAPVTHQADLDMNAILKLCLEEAAAQYGANIDLDMEQIRVSEPREVYQMVLSALKSGGVISYDAEAEELKELVHVCTKNIAMLNMYKGGKIKTDIILLHPHNSTQKEDLKHQHDPYFGWDKFTDGSIRLIEVNGSHMTMMFEPYIKEVVTALREHLV